MYGDYLQIQSVIGKRRVLDRILYSIKSTFTQIKSNLHLTCCQTSNQRHLNPSEYHSTY